jgi:hypothetical protein
MKKFKNMLLLAGVSAALSLSSANVLAQGQGGFDPEQMRARMMERVREQLEVKDDAEWKIISERAEKVMAARRDAGGGGMGGMFGRPPGGGRREGGGGGGGGNAGGGERRRGGGMFGEPSQEQKDLQEAIESKAPADQVKAKLEKYRAYKKAKEAELAKSQEQLKEVLNARQEAAAVLAGLLP